VRWLLLVPVFAWGQSLADRGADVFSKTCSSGYCHGSKGAGAGAPRLAQRGFDEARISSVVRAGVPGTAMRGYGTELTRGDFAAVVAYVASLNGIAPRPAEPEPPALPPEAARGLDLFSDAVRGFARCSTCHEGGGRGIAVAPIENVPANVAALRGIAAPQVRTATAEGSEFPALVVSQGGRRTSLYDLTAPPPVLRSFDSREVQIREGTSWHHAAALQGYSDSELESILAFLRVTEKSAR